MGSFLVKYLHKISLMSGKESCREDANIKMVREGVTPIFKIPTNGFCNPFLQVILSDGSFSGSCMARSKH